MDRGSEQVFSQRHSNGQQTQEKMLNINNYWGNINKTIMKYHLTPGRMAAIKKDINNRCWKGYKEKGTFVHCLWDCKLVQPPQKILWSFLKEVKNKTTI